MPAFEDVLGVKLANLSEAVTEWTTTIEKLTDLAERANDVMAVKADRADWRGENAGVTRPFITKTAKEFNDAVKEATLLRDTLRDAHTAFTRHKRALEKLVQEAPRQDLHIDGRGFVRSTKGEPLITSGTNRVGTPLLTEESPGEQAKVDAMVGRIKKVLSEAAEDDRRFSQTLAAVTGKDPHNFTSYSSLEDATEALAVQAAKEAAELGSKPNPTQEELIRFNSLLAAHKNNTAFGEALATELEAEKTLEMWANLADPYQRTPDPERAKILEEVQNNLSVTLASATQSSSSEMQAWEKKVIALGDNRLGIDAAGNPYGFQVMSSLMRKGEFDKGFLREYGNALLELDKKHNERPGSLWTGYANTETDLNYGEGEDRGRDPVTGFLEALGHNPQAATEFFKQPGGAGEFVDRDSEINKHLAYLTQEREWTPDAGAGSEADTIHGRKALGHALEAATTGYAYDAPELTGESGLVQVEERRSAETAAVMEQVVHIYGSDNSLVHEQPEMADSLGRMGSAYIDDLNYTLSGIGDSSAGKDESDFPAKYKGRAEFGRTNTIDFFSIMGQNETTHAYMTRAEVVYTLTSLEAFPATNDENYGHGRDVLHTHAEARGILDAARANQAASEHTQGSEEHNKSLGRSTEWTKFAIGTAVGAGIACLPVPGSGAAGAAIVPLVSETSGEAVKTFLGQQADKSAEKAEDDPSEIIQVTRDEFFTAGENDIANTYLQYFEGKPRAEDMADEENLIDDLKNAYTGIGPEADKYRGKPPYKGD
ncbi:hypothetical protein [Streptomyces albus]|uniref:hypothetical protein n=1 Tax=Streptomyces albus TaxID=1888 RepID=UPI0004C7A682|nr:hypothetical protein [Streptomyces albus]